MEFLAFPKIPRLRRDVVVTEKIDGTNAQILIVDTAESGYQSDPNLLGIYKGMAFYAGSRNRFITPANDNFGFATWVSQHVEQLVELGAGRHFGEWYGQGIQRGYGLTEKRFALFNTGRWDMSNVPECCEVVPVLLRGSMEQAVNICLRHLKESGSVAAPGFMKPEGVVVYHSASRSSFKVLIENDDIPKGVAEAAHA